MPVTERTAHATTQIFGLVLLTTATIAAAIVGLLFTEGEGTFVPNALIAAAVTWIVWRFDRTWATVVGIVGTLAVTLGLFFLAFGVFQVFSPVEFLLGVLLVLGFFISLVAGIMVLVARSRDQAEPVTAGSGFRRTVMGAVGVLAVVSIGGFVLTRSTVSEAEAQGAVPVDMAKFEFEPGDTTVSQGQKLLLTNSDPVAHDFTLDEFDVSEYFGPGGDGIVDLGSVPPGTYTYVCSLHTDPNTGEGMTGQLTIES
jgi:plastocyanin